MSLVQGTQGMPEMPFDKTSPLTAVPHWSHRGRGGLGSLVTGDLGHQLGQHAVRGSTGCQASLVATRWGWVSLWADSPVWVNCCRRTRQVTSPHTCEPFWESCFLVSSLAGIEVWAA